MSKNTYYITNNNAKLNFNTLKISSSVSASASLSKSKEKTTVQSSLNAGSIDIDVENNTNLQGALISSTQDTLNIDTKTLTSSNLSNTKTSRNVSMGGSTTQTANKKDTQGKEIEGTSKLANVSGNLALGSTNTKSKTLATITAGNINVANTQESSDISKLNRNKEDVNLNLYDVKSDVSVSAELDTRLLSKEGQDEIAKEAKEFGKNVQTIAKGLPEANNDNPIIATIGK